MTPEKFSDAIGLLDDDILQEVENIRSAPARSKSRRPLWIGLAATAACAVIIGGIALKYAGSDGAGLTDPVGSDIAGAPDGEGGSEQPAALCLMDVTYPQRVPYPVFSEDYDGGYEEYSRQSREWHEIRRARVDSGRQSSGEVMEFFRDTAAVFLSESGGENAVYSPVNVYVAMAMLSEITDGESRGQLLSALGADSLDSLRSAAYSAWNGCYCDDGLTASELANALWLDSGISYNADTLSVLAESYYTSSHSGVMGSDDYSAALREWVNLHTGGLLADSVSQLGLKPETVMALTSTTYFKAQWDSAYGTRKGTFTAADGSVQQCDYITRDASMYCYWGDSFQAISMGLKGGSDLWIILPDEGVSPEQLTADGQVMELLEKGANKYPDFTWLSVHVSVPMFDISDDMSLIDGMTALGVTDIFDSTAADFSPLLENAAEYTPYISKAQHATRVMLDEEGCTGASYVEMIANTGAMPAPDEELYFTADRPFMFAVVNDCGIPLYCGIVNELK